MGNQATQEQIQMRARQSKATLEQNYRERQLQINEISYRLLSEIETLVAEEMPNFQREYTKFSSGESHDSTKRLLNIQMFTTGLQILVQDDQKLLQAGFPELRLPAIPERYMSNLDLAYKNLKGTLTKDMLAHVIKGFDRQHLDPIPEDLSTRIMAPKDRKVIMKEMSDSKQYLIADTMVNALQVQKQLHQSLDERRDQPIYPGESPAPLYYPQSTDTQVGNRESQSKGNPTKSRADGHQPQGDFKQS